MNKRTTPISSEFNQIVCLALVTALCLLGDSMLYVALPLYWNEVGLNSLWEVGLILSVNRLIRLPFHPIIGWLYTKIPFRTGFIIAVLLTVVATTGYGLWKGFWVWLILRSLWGIAWSLLIIGGYITVTKYGKESHRGHYMGTFNGLYRLGSLFGMFLGGVLASIVGLRFVALIFGILAVLGIPFIYYFISESPPEKKAPADNAGAWKMSWVSKEALKILLSGFLIAMLVRGLLTSTLSLVIGDHFGETILIFGIPLGAAALSGGIQAARWSAGSFFAAKFGRMSDGEKGRGSMFVMLLVLAAVGFFLVPVQFPLYLWLLNITLVMIAVTSLTTLSDSLASDMAQRSFSVVKLTAYAMAVDLGAAVGPLFSYLTIMLRHGIFIAYAGGALVFILLAVGWYNLPETQ